jgi:hypothetical protein
MRNFLRKAIPITILVIFILIMLSGGFLKRPLGKNDNIPKIINDITENVKAGTWEKVSTGTDELEKAWKRVEKRIQFSSERDEMNYISTNIARLRAAVAAEDKTNALLELFEAYDHWKGLSTGGLIVPMGFLLR